MLAARTDQEYQQIINQADLITIDGFGLAAAIFFLYHQWPDRLTGADLAEELFKMLAERKLSVYLLGGASGVAVRAAENIREHYPGLRIAGAQSGGRWPDNKNDEGLIQQIKEAAPDVLLISFGSPAQDKWLKNNLAKLSSVKLAVGVGGAIDIWAGGLPRAPKFLQQTGLEWLWRLYHEPWRFLRILKAVFVFPWLVLKEKNN
jgi:N-acetylglucosaminyldiphosphoundecaprenol N-acetyl-beta-D-mannosaminyltransferase